MSTLRGCDSAPFNTLTGLRRDQFLEVKGLIPHHRNGIEATLGRVDQPREVGVPNSLSPRSHPLYRTTSPISNRGCRVSKLIGDYYERRREKWRRDGDISRASGEARAISRTRARNSSQPSQRRE